MRIGSRSASGWVAIASIGLFSAGAVLTQAAAAQEVQSSAPAIYKDPAAPIDTRIEDLLSRMTLEEKVAQMLTIWEQKEQVQTAQGDFDPAKASEVWPHGIGMIARPSDFRGVDQSNSGDAGASAGARNRTARETVEYVNAAQRWAVNETRLGIPILMHEEGLHGYVARGATSFPQAIGLASTWDKDLIEQVYSVASREMRSRGAQIALSPVVDIARDPRWGRIEETYGEDPYLVSEIGLAAIRGFQGQTLPLADDKVLVTLKHMTGHGQPESGTNVAPAELTEHTLRTYFFPPFERAIKEGNALSVMPSYNEIGGVPSHANGWLLNDILKDEWGFDGAVVSDYFAIREMVTRHQMLADAKQAAERAIKAGVDSEMADADAFKELPSLVAEGRVDGALIDDAVRRILRLKFIAGMFENPYADADHAERIEANPEAIALALEAARKSMVLLKNDGLLPLNADKIEKLLVVGTHAKDTPLGGYSDVPRKVVSVLEGIENAAKGKFDVAYSEGVRITESREWAADPVDLVPEEENSRLIAEAVKAAESADTIVLVIGGNEQTSREAWATTHLGDRTDITLVGQQMELARAMLATGKPVVTLLLNGRPLSIVELQDTAPAIIEGWYLGQETGNAVADVLFGKSNPGGKMPVTVARNVGQVPVFYNHKPQARRGYLFDTIKPLYPFGFGLSYSSFEISAPNVLGEQHTTTGPVSVEVSVSNTGRFAGDEVVQLYLRDVHASVTTPVKQLVRFERVTLEPGETRTVKFELAPSDFSLWNDRMERVVEPGQFVLMSGSNSRDVKETELVIK
ncbi:glycoside hydrolase family 3 N-terminal domain-containing protein [Erythrobacter crassostreae]|uniref:beta-glucosidase n=1 Tax=Erythrobacter crassostreae TaxID=2828328 RepID=A0A9X1F3I6_9SPHN|nr:glycoside hydrolase family 3 N-terminal domain-containing protein [Erythrobacter crassostrea]MBV7259054.1 glycoside hydrolase family 3 C-terminal domain-containing protein [Erythrobacter crassostrea]